MPDWTMRPANWTTPPYSSTIADVRSSRRAEAASCSRRRIFARSSLADRPKLANAILAAAMARRGSSSSASHALAKRPDALDRPMQIQVSFRAADEWVRAGFCKLDQKHIRIMDHEVDLEEIGRASCR